MVNSSIRRPCLCHFNRKTGTQILENLTAGVDLTMIETSGSRHSIALIQCNFYVTRYGFLALNLFARGSRAGFGWPLKGYN
jgi:hypothetical protein